MKYPFIFFILLFYLFSFQSTIYAAGSTTAGDHSVYDTIHKGPEKTTPQSSKPVDSQTPSLFPLFIKFIVSFALVIVLIVLLLRFLSKKSHIAIKWFHPIPRGSSAWK